MGLSIVHGIVEKHKGHINVYSEIGKGTAFHVYLPLAKSSNISRKQQVDTLLPIGKESILVVDDEQAIVEMEQQCLEKLGYTVISRTSSVEALEAFKANPQRFDLIITDMTMPKMSGESLALEIKNLRPNIPIILCTGFSECIVGDEENSGFDAFLMKPVTRTKMAKLVRSLIDGGWQPLLGFN